MEYLPNEIARIAEVYHKLANFVEMLEEGNCVYNIKELEDCVKDYREIVPEEVQRRLTIDVDSLDQLCRNKLSKIEEAMDTV